MEQYLSPATTHRRETAVESVGAEGRSVELSFSSEQPVMRYDWLNDEEYGEILDHSEGAPSLERLRSVGVVLFNHDSRTLPVARIERVWLDGAARKGRARITFDGDEEAERVFRKVKSGFLRGVSVGYKVSEWERIARGVTQNGVTGPAMIARKWEPLEISIVTVPADANVGVGRSIGMEENDMEERNQDHTHAASAAQNPASAERNSAPAAQNPAPAPRSEPAPAAAPAQRSEPAQGADPATAVAAERARAAEIAELCRAFGMDPAEFVRSGATVAEVNAAIVRRCRAERQPLPLAGSRQALHVNADETDKFRAAAADGLRLRLGARLERPADGAEAFRGAHLIDLAREIVERGGERVGNGMSYMELAKRAMGTGDFPIILGNVANAILLDSYRAAPSTWRGWCGVGSLSDFKVQKTVRLSETGDLELIPEGGEYVMADFAEAEDGIQLYTYGKKFALTRQAIVNDDLRAFTRLPTLFGSAAARTVNRAVYALLTGNPKMAETGKPLFNAAHNNLAAPGSAFAGDSLSAARTAMRRQKGLKGVDDLNLTPSFVIVPPELETGVEKLLFSDTDLTAAAAGVKNVFKNALTMVVESCLTDPKAWYLAASSSAVDTFEVAFLDGVQAPVIEQRESWDTDGIEYKIRLDFGVKAWDYRGLYKNPGA